MTTALRPADANEAQTVAHILANYRCVAVVGLSPKTHRESHVVARYMQAHGWRIIPINPNASEILGEKAYPTLAAAAAAEHRIELVPGGGDRGAWHENVASRSSHRRLAAYRLDGF